jgi:hypothetical protein
MNTLKVGDQVKRKDGKWDNTHNNYFVSAIKECSWEIEIIQKRKNNKFLAKKWYPYDFDFKLFHQKRRKK